MAKKHYMVLDTETVTDARVPYDVAWIIVDRKGNEVERFNGLTEEVMGNPTGRYMLRHDSFSKRKASFYLDSISMNDLIMPFEDIKARTNAALEQYHCPVVAYNAAFDVKVLNNFSDSILGARFFNNAPVWDLWTMALNIICDSNNYVQWCKNSNFITDKGNLKSSAESVYSYLFNDVDFEEQHTALADCEIEAQILQKVFQRKRKLYTSMCGFVSRQPVWIKRLKKN